MAIINALTDTWNNVATTFTAIKMTVTDTTSAAGSKLIDLIVGSTSMFSVTKDGTTKIGTAGFKDHGSGQVGFGGTAADSYYASAQGFQIAGSRALNFGAAFGVSDIGFYRVDANTLATGAGGASYSSKNLKFGSSIMDGLTATDAAAPTIASAGTIAPTKQITFISGTTTISNITVPSPISAGGGHLTIIPTGLWSTNTAGNIALATTAVVNKALILTYDVTTAKWYPSY